MALRQPGVAALKIPRGRTDDGSIDYLTLTFAELDAEVAAWSTRLTTAGIRRGDRTLLMVKQGLPLIAAAFALFKLGAVPVVIDPGMGLKNFLACVARSQPRALVGIPLAQFISRVFRSTFSSVKVRVTASRSLTARLTSPGEKSISAPIVDSLGTDLAAILFTSGSTGTPKGVCYEHGMFEAQVKLIRETYGIQPGEIDLPMLPIFALFNPALGMTTIVPEIDPSRPASVDPEKIIRAIHQEHVTNSFGSPTLWGKIGDHCVNNDLTLPTMKRVLCAGAPVPVSLWEKSKHFLPHGELHSPYGATESLPISSTRASDFQKNAPLFGSRLGRPLAGLDVKIIAATDGPIATLTDARELPPGEIGEIIVSGPVVTKEYDRLPAATAAAKIAAVSQPSTLIPQLPPWHRLGDCGYFDAAGVLWFCGRKVERVETATAILYTEPCEQVFRAHPRVGRCALIGLGERGTQQPALVVEIAPKNSADAQSFAEELRVLGHAHPHTAGILHFYFLKKFPVDVRHNAKIHRLTLARWAATAKGFTAKSAKIAKETEA